jgi:class 3 adenylate cyclase
VLPRLTADDLIALGITSIGHRRKLLDAIAALDQGRAAAAAEPIAATVRTVEAERRQLTVLFCDLVGSTELAARLDPEDLRGVMGAYHRCTAAVIERFEGHVAKYLGDGVLAYFGWPQAHEDDAERAVRAGLELVATVARLKPHTDVRLQARIGIATGQVVVGDLVGAGATRDEAVVGDTPNLAARLQAIAEPATLDASGRGRPEHDNPTVRTHRNDLLDRRACPALMYFQVSMVFEVEHCLTSGAEPSRPDPCSIRHCCARGARTQLGRINTSRSN